MAEQSAEEQGAPHPMAEKTIPAGLVGASGGTMEVDPATSAGHEAAPSTKEDPIWISKREVRRAAPRTSGSKKTTYYIEFFLVDNHGYETLAATGEDQGDAHYTYRNAASFPTYGNLEVHNRKELLSWLDKIIEGTQKAHNFHLVSDDEDGLSASVAVTPGSPVTLPTFITTREQKSHDDGGRRRQQWWLVDDNGHEHLAVVGEERDPRDGHYNYYAEKPFSLIRPLACQNRTRVHEYLEAFITHPGEEPHSYTASPKKPVPQEFPGPRPAFGSASVLTGLGMPEAQPSHAKTGAASLEPGSSAARSQARSSAGSQQKKAGAGRGKGDTGHKGSKGSKKGMKRSASFAFGPAEGEMGMRRRSVNEEEAAEAAAQEAVTAMLQQRAASKAAWQSAARRAALEWLRSPATEAAAKAVADWQDTLQVALSELHSSAPSPAVPQLAAPPSDTAPPSSASMRQPNGLDRMRLSEETAGLFGGDSLPIMLNGSTAHGSQLGYQQQQPSVPSAPAVPMAIDGSTSDGGPQDGAGGPEVNAQALTEALDAMRDLGSLHATLPLFASTGLVDTFKQLAVHHEAAIADLAAATLEQWRKVWVHHMEVLLDPAFQADPRSEARALLKAITDHVGAARCRREPKTPMLACRPQVNGALLSAPGSSMPSGLPPPSNGGPDSGPASAAAPAQSLAPAPKLPPSAASGMPAAPVPHTAHGLSLLALLQNSGGLPGTPGSLLSALSAGMQVTPGLPSGLPPPAVQPPSELAQAAEGRRLHFATPAGSSSAQAGTEMVPGSAAADSTAAISGLTPVRLKLPPLQEGNTGSPCGPERPKDWATEQRSQRGGSRLQAASADAASQEMPAGAGAQRAGQGRDVSPADAAVLKDIGLTSGEESSADAWGSSGDEDAPHLDAAQELDSKDASSDALVSFLSQQKGRLTACKHRRVWRVAEDAVNQTLAALQAIGCPQDALQQAKAVSESIKTHASRLSRDAPAGMNSKAKGEVELALQHLLEIVTGVRDAKDRGAQAV